MGSLDQGVVDECKSGSSAGDQGRRGLRAADAHVRRRRGSRPDLGRERLQPVGHAATAPEVGLQVADRHHRTLRTDRPGRRRRGRRGHEGLGDGEGLHPLRPRLLPADRPDRREARQLLRAGRRWSVAGRIRRQDPDPGRVGRLQLPQRRPAQHLRGPRLHRLGSDQPGLHPGQPQRQDALHPDHLRLDVRRRAGPQDAAAALPAGDVGARRPGAETVRPHEHRQGGVLRRAGAGVLPGRPALLPGPPGPDGGRSHPVRRQAAEGPGVRRPLLRRHPAARAGLHDGLRAGAVQARASPRRPVTRRSRRRSSRSRRCSSGPTSPPTTSSC